MKYRKYWRAENTVFSWYNLTKTKFPFIVQKNKVLRSQSMNHVGICKPQIARIVRKKKLYCIIRFQTGYQKLLWVVLYMACMIGL